ncbi:MAG: hypothetical protein JXL80_00255 [Planctomycetes bacterium]|nr:hypothetical protein [Planctomycetota bacterium]
MTANETVVRGVQWNRVFSIGHLLRTFRIALWPPSKLLLCLAAIVVTVGLGILLDQVFKTNVYGQSFRENMVDVYLAATGTTITERPVTGRPEHMLSVESYKLGLAARTTNGLIRQFKDLYGDNAYLVKVAPEESINIYLGLSAGSRGFWFGPLEAIRHVGRLTCRYWQEAPWFAAINWLIALLTWAFFGGAVARLAAVQFATDVQPSLREAFSFTCKRYVSLVTSPLALLIVIALISLVVFLPAALVMWIKFAGEIVLGVLFIFVLILGFVLSLLALFAVSSLGLQAPAIAVEGRDAFDAISRGVNYVFARPWRYIFYTLFSFVYMCLSFVLVRAFVFMMLKIPHSAMKMFCFADNQAAKLDHLWTEPTLYRLFAMPEGAEGTEYAAAVLIAVAVFILLGLMVSFLPSFVITSQTIIYFLLRRMVDEKDIDEVYMPEEHDVNGLDRLERSDETEIEPEPPVEETSEAASAAKTADAGAEKDDAKADEDEKA